MGTISNNQPMPRGGARPGAGRKPDVPGNPRTEVFTTRCTPDEKAKYEALKAELDQLNKQKGNNS